MKKLLTMILCALLVLSLCACGGNDMEQTNPVITGSADETTEPVQTTQGSEIADPVDDTTAPSDGGDDAQDNGDARAKAESCIDKDVQQLYALIGQPNSSDYATSCLGDGEDGMLYYDGFIVYTYRENGVETVSYVE